MTSYCNKITLLKVAKKTEKEAEKVSEIQRGNHLLNYKLKGVYNIVLTRYSPSKLLGLQIIYSKYSLRNGISSRRKQTLAPQLL